MMAAVEGMKDNGFARWNYPLRSLHQLLKKNIRTYSQANKLFGSFSSMINSAKKGKGDSELDEAI